MAEGPERACTRFSWAMGKAKGLNMVTTISGTSGTHGTNGAHPGNGGNGTDASFTQNGVIGGTPPNVLVKGGKGGAGGNKTTGVNLANGGNGGNGGNATATINGNIFNTSATTTLKVAATAQGGDGGAGGTTISPLPNGPGAQGNGGNGTITMSGNILQPNKNMVNMELDGFAIGGRGTVDGNASSTMSGNIIQGTSTNASINASATVNGPDDPSNDGNSAFGTKTTNVNGNIISGKINNATLNSNWSASPNYSNSTANLDGNIVSTTSATSGAVTLEAAGQHIDIEQNKVNLGGTQSMNLLINELSPAYDATIKGNDFEGTGHSAFFFTDNGVPGPSLTPDTVAIDLGNNSFMFDGKNNKLKGFTSVTLAGNNYSSTITGTAGNDTLVGGGGNDTFIATTGTDTYNGGGGINTVSYANGTGPNGVTVNLGLQPAQQPIGGGFGPDTLINIQNVIGTNFNDTLTGDANANVLSGGAGNDMLFATAGGDTLDGGTGTDTANFSLSTSGVTVDMNVQGTPQTVGGSIGTITLTSIENVIGSAFDDTLIAGLAGPETLDGGSGGSDTADFRHGTSGVTVDLGIQGIPQAVGGGFSPITLNNIANLTGSAFNDTLTAGLGAAILTGGAGDDILNGNGVNTTASFADSAGGVTASLLAGTATGDGNDTLNNITNLIGSSFNDLLIGDGNANTISGGAGNDILWGMGGNDTLDGGAGTDTAYFSGRESQYVITGTLPGAVTVAGPDGTDSLNNIERLKFLSPTHVSDVDGGPNFTGDLIFQSNINGNLQVRTLAPNATLPNITGIGIAWHAVGTGQFTADSDRLAGILLQNTTTQNLEVVTAVAGTPVVTALSASPGAGWTAITAGDFDGDGASDVLLQQGSGGPVKIMFLAGGGASGAVGTVLGTSANIASPGANWNAIASGDFNGDGKSDILWQNSVTQNFEVWEMNGANILAQSASIGAVGLTAIGTGDFNGDGDSDIVFRDPAGDAVIATMSGTIVGPVLPTVTAPVGFTLMGAEDVDGNGYSDLLWQNSATGNVKATPFIAGVAQPTINLGAPNNTFHLVASTGGG